MNTFEKIDSLRISQKAILISIIFAVVEFSYTIIFESESNYFMFYVVLIGAVWFTSLIICSMYAEYVEKPQMGLLNST